jgi:hypothetical protein
LNIDRQKPALPLFYGQKSTGTGVREQAGIEGPERPSKGCFAGQALDKIALGKIALGKVYLGWSAGMAGEREE